MGKITIVNKVASMKASVQFENGGRVFKKSMISISPINIETANRMNRLVSERMIVGMLLTFLGEILTEFGSFGL